MRARAKPPLRALAAAVLLLSSPVLVAAPASAASGKATSRCRTHAEVAACYDAVRWSPGDPTLLVALGDALARANRPDDARRNYLRAAELAPHMRGLAAKISATETALHSKGAPAKLPVKRGVVAGVPAKRYSNAAPVAQSH